MNKLPSEIVARMEAWLDDARACEVILEPTAMVLATVQPDGTPAARTVLLKGLDVEGLVFYTNYESAKARDLAHCQAAALCFHWDPLRRQIRVQGTVSRVEDAVSDAYFASRPRGSQIGAWASAQSSVLEDPQILVDRVAQYEERFAGGPVPRPEFWGGYRLVPERIEFWASRRDRLHVREVHAWSEGQWRASALYP